MLDKDERVLVTGATGFIGRTLCSNLAAEGFRVAALGRTPKDGPWERFFRADLAGDVDLSACMENVTTVFHLAGLAHAGAAKGADPWHEVIVGGTRRLLEAARAGGVKRFIFMSSVKAMGEGNRETCPAGPIDEQSACAPQSPYGGAKLEAEKLVLESGIRHAVALRPVMVFGSSDKGNLPRMIDAVRRSRFPPIPENGNRRSLIHVEDLVAFARRAAEYPVAAGRTYILAGPEAVSTRQLYDAIREGLGMTPVRWSVPLWLLRSAAIAGTVAGSIFLTPVPLDREVLGKLTGSAWYSSRLAEEELDYTAQQGVLEWLRQPRR